jgi:hypothetical protein
VWITWIEWWIVDWILDGGRDIGCEWRDGGWLMVVIRIRIRNRFIIRMMDGGMVGGWNKEMNNYILLDGEKIYRSRGPNDWNLG